MQYEFEVEGDILGKERPRVNMYTGNVYTPNKTKKYEEYIQQCFCIKYPNYEPIINRTEIEIIAYIKIPTYCSKKKQLQMKEGEITPTKKPDVDNIAKVILDALNTFAFIDDNQVSKISVEKRYDDKEWLSIHIKEY